MMSHREKKVQLFFPPAVVTRGDLSEGGGRRGKSVAGPK